MGIQLFHKSGSTTMKVLLLLTIVILLGDSTFGCMGGGGGGGISGINNNCGGSNNGQGNCNFNLRSLSRNKIEEAVAKADGVTFKKRSDLRLLDKFDDEDASEGDQLEAFEQLSFTLCNKDGNDGLTWDEIKACKGKYCGNKKLVERKDCPKKSAFNSFDTNKDGILLYSEWKAQVAAE